MAGGVHKHYQELGPVFKHPILNCSVETSQAMEQCCRCLLFSPPPPHFSLLKKKEMRGGEEGEKKREGEGQMERKATRSCGINVLTLSPSGGKNNNCRLFTGYT